MTKPTAKATSPHRMAGTRAWASPARPGSSSPARPTLAGGLVPLSTGATAGGGGTGSAVWFGPSTAVTINRCEAVKRGVQVVSVNRLSVVGSITDTSFGLTALLDST